MPMPLGAGFAKILLAAQFDGSPRPRLLRSLLWPVGVIFGCWTVIWLSSLLLFVRAAEPNPPVLSGQRASIQSEHYWGRVCRKRHGELTGALPLRSAGTVHGVKGAPSTSAPELLGVQDSRSQDLRGVGTQVASVRTGSKKHCLRDHEKTRKIAKTKSLLNA